MGGLLDKLELLWREQAQGAAGWAVEDVTLLSGGLQAAVQPWAVGIHSFQVSCWRALLAEHV